MHNFKNILITGGAGFIGSNLISCIVNKHKFSKILSIDNYSTGYRKNHVKNKDVLYLNLDCQKIFKTQNKLLRNFRPNYIFHLGEFSRVVPSFKSKDICLDSNIVGTLNVIKYALRKKSKLIYSASSIHWGTKYHSLSPYAWTKSKNVELIENFSKWFNLNFTVVTFFNVYGKNQIKSGKMSSVIGNFENQYLKNKRLTVVKPGTQQRDFIHIDDAIQGIVLGAIKGINKEYHIGSGKAYSIKKVAEMFKKSFKLIKKRPGEVFTGKANLKLAKKELGYFPKKDLKKYINFFLKKTKA